jgi:hypothetical protein
VTTQPSDAIVRHWVLNLAVNFPVPLWQLYPVVRVETLNVKEIPGLAAEDYLAALQELLKCQLIQISRPEGARAPDWANMIKFLKLLPVAPSPEMAKMPGGQISFELTPRGGATWESLADPDWNHILIESSDLESCELLSPDRNQLMAYMGWYRELHDRAIDLRTVKLTHRTDFAILYWKRLASVYHASFQLKSPTMGRRSGEPLWSFPWFREWAALRWHRDPWDLPGWPGRTGGTG